MEDLFTTFDSLNVGDKFICPSASEGKNDVFIKTSEHLVPYPGSGDLFSVNAYYLATGKPVYFSVTAKAIKITF